MNGAYRRTSLVLLFVLTSGAHADDFERLEGAVLSGVLSTDKVTARDRLTVADLGSLRGPFRDLRAPVLIVRTSKGNLARLIVAHAFRETPDLEASLPVVVLERFETFEMPGAKNRMARGRGVLLFDKFCYDLDSGQVVPPGTGGDLQFLATGDGVARLVAEGSAKIYSLNSSPLPDDKPNANRPSAGRAILAGDFAGRYRLFANGQLSGDLDMSVDDRGAVSGSFRSDQTGSAYRVSGQVAPEAPSLIKFSITFPRSQQDFDGYLWAEGKSALAGTSTLVNRTFGFFALREGGRYAPYDAAAGLNPANGDAPGRKDVAVDAEGRLHLDGKSLDLAGLSEALKACVTADPKTWVAVKVAPTAPYATLAGLLESIRAIGVADVRVLPVVDERAKP